MKTLVVFAVSRKQAYFVRDMLAKELSLARNEVGLVFVQVDRVFEAPDSTRYELSEADEGLYTFDDDLYRYIELETHIRQFLPRDPEVYLFVADGHDSTETVRDYLGGLHWQPYRPANNPVGA